MRPTGPGVSSFTSRGGRRRIPRGNTPRVSVTANTRATQTKRAGMMMRNQPAPAVALGTAVTGVGAGRTEEA